MFNQMNWHSVLLSFSIVVIKYQDKGKLGPKSLFYFSVHGSQSSSGGVVLHKAVDQAVFKSRNRTGLSLSPCKESRILPRKWQHSLCSLWVVLLT